MAESGQYLPFEIDGIRYVVPLKDVAYVISSTDQFPCCAPPKRNSCVKYMIQVDQNLMSVVELTALGENSGRDPSKPQRPFILAFNCPNGLLGLLADHISPLLKLTNPTFEKVPLSQCAFLSNDERNLILFDILELYKAIEPT